MKRRRRKASEIRRLRTKLLEAVKKEGRSTLTDLIVLYGASIGIKDTPYDKIFARKQLAILAQEDKINLQLDGINLVTSAKPSPRPPTTPEPPAAPRPAEPAEEIRNAELDAIKAYAQQVESFAESLQQQVRNLVEMI